MKLTLFPLVLFFLSLVFATTSLAQAPQSAQLGRDIPYRFLDDPKGAFSLDEVLALPPDAFVVKRSTLSQGYTDAVNWLLFEIPAQAFQGQDLWFEVSPPYLDDIRLYYRDGALDQPWFEQRLGDRLPASARPIDHRFFVFELPPPEEGDLLPVVIRLETTSTNILTGKLWTPADFASAALAETTFWSFFFGLVFFALVLTLIMSVLLKSRALLALFSFGSISFLFIGNVYGFSAWIFFRNFPMVADVQVGITLILGSTTLFWTLQEVFQLRHYFPRIHKIFNVYIVLSLLFLVTPFVGFYGVIAVINILAVNAALWLCFGISIYLGYKHKRLFLPLGVGLLVYSTATTFTSISALGLIEFRQILYTAWHYSMVFLIIIVLGVTAQWVRMDALARRQQAQLERDLAHERDANMLQRQFIALVSHEFLNPLSAISLQTQLAQRELALNQGDPQKRYSAIERATNRLKKLFDQWLNNNRILEPNLELRPESIELAHWVPRVIEDGLVYQDRELQFEIEPITLIADPELLKIALMNLVDNAYKYSPMGTGITIAIKRQGRCVRFSVIDQGAGIPIEEQPHIFKRLFRSERHTNHPGLGLGLHFSQRIARLHGGEIHYEQLSPNRCAFTILLPMNTLEN